MDYTITDKNNKKISYKFPNKKEEEEYISICEDWCGGVPVDVIWAKGIKRYQSILNERKNKNREPIANGNVRGSS